VRDHTWQQLQALRWPAGEHVLTLSQALAQLRDTRVQLLIVDVKASAAPAEQVGRE
jgi:hypothetical protein